MSGSDIGSDSQEVSPFIDGALLQSTSGSEFRVINPSNGQLCLSIPTGNKEDVDRAVVSSRRAFNDGRWREAPPSFRKRVLHKLADLIAGEAAAFDALDAEEMGKPVSVAF